MSKKEMTQKVKELRELRRFIDELTGEAEAIADEIKAQMTADGVDTLTGDDFKVTWKPIKTSRFDGKAFKTAMPDLYERFVRQTETRRFVLA